MSLIVEQRRTERRQPDARRKEQLPFADSDLPVLGIERSPRIYLDWQSFMEDGVPPSLALGAERRWRGVR
jgi:hypothetical protein